MRTAILVALFAQSFCLYAQELPTPLPEPKITQVPEQGFDSNPTPNEAQSTPSQPLTPVNPGTASNTPSSQPSIQPNPSPAPNPGKAPPTPETKPQTTKFAKQWVPTHQRPVIKRVWIPAQNIQVRREAVRSYVDACGYTYQVIEPVWEWVSTPGRYENRTVWETVPGHWEHVPANGASGPQLQGGPVQSASAIAPT